MKKRIPQLIATILFLLLIVGYVYSLNNPIVLFKEQQSITLCEKTILAPRGWTTGDYDQDGETIKAFIDPDGVLRVAIGIMDMKEDFKFEDIDPSIIPQLCTSVISADMQPINEPQLTIVGNTYRLEYQYMIEEDYIFVNFTIPLDSNIIYEILEVKPDDDTSAIRAEALEIIT